MNAELHLIGNLSEADKARMFAVFDRHFLNAHRDQFEADLANKNYVLILRNNDASVAGFSTLAVYRTPSVDAPVVCSGDTVVEQAARSTCQFLAAWLHAVWHLRREYHCDRFHWLLIVSGFRTYRLLPVFWKASYPRFDRLTPPTIQAMIARLAAKRFGPRFDSKSGLVRFANPQILRHRKDREPDGRLSDPHVAFFSRANPFHERGDELVTLTEMCDDNLTPAGRRLLARSVSLVIPEPIS